MVTFRTTRLSRSFGVVHSAATTSCLLVRIYPLEGVEKPLDLAAEKLTIGRDSGCSLRLSADSVSRQHAAIEWEGDDHFVTDLQSTNGTFLNERRLVHRELLKNGDRVRFGNQIFKYLKSDQIEGQFHEVVFKMMTTDGLTSVYNRRYFLEVMDREIIQSYRSSSPLCVILMDLDRFKSVNDTYGHLAGDAVLVEFARRAKSVLRSGELLARYGGEEFAMILTRASLEDGVAAAERVRQITAATPVMFDSNPIPITVSLGVHCFDGLNIRQSDELIAAADSLLYQAKRLGRNQVQFEHQEDEDASICQIDHQMTSDA